MKAISHYDDTLRRGRCVRVWNVTSKHEKSTALFAITDLHRFADLDSNKMTSHFICLLEGVLDAGQRQRFYGCGKGE